jgi:chromosome segregation ATPase
MIESQDEITEMKRKFKIMNHQIEQLKEEIVAKDHALVKEHFERNKVEKKKDHAKQELAKRKKLLADAEDTLEKQHAEIGKLTHVIAKMDDDMLRQHKEYDQVISERDILGTQLIRRNDELALLYEKIKIMQSTLRKGEAQYQERCQDIKVLKLKISDIKRELSIFKNKCGQLTELKREVFHLQRELLQEKTKVKALSEELENPMNVHRWRKLEGSDPATYEMIQKIQTLQKRLIQKTEQVVEKDLLIQEKEKLYVELKNILARQPGPEVAEQLSVYQSSIKEKTRQMKAMASELNMYQAQINEHKYEIERMTRELQDTKRKYYDQRRKEQINRKTITNAGSPTVGSPVANNPKAMDARAYAQAAAAAAASNRFTGGGFNLTAK